MVKEKNWFSLYDKGTITTIYGGMLFLNGMLIALCVFFTANFLEDNDYWWIVLDILLISAIIIMFCLSIKNNAWRKYCINCLVTKDGICFNGLLWKKFNMKWDDIRTCGIYNYNVSYIRRVIIIFSTDCNMASPENVEEINQVSRERVALEYRPEVWDILSQHLPDDILKRFSDAISHGRNAFFRR